MKICMIGDSHLAMLVNAHRQQPLKDLDITLISWPRQLQDQVSVQGTEFCATGPELIADWAQYGLPARVDLAAFDKVVFVSYTITAFNAFGVLRDHSISGWNEAGPLVKKLQSPMGSPDDRRLMTPAMLNECLAGLLRENHSFGFIDEVCKHSPLPITVVPAPFLAENTLKHRKHFWALKMVLRNRDGEALANALRAAHETAFAPFPNVTVLHQPPQTIIQGCLTREIYREGAMRNRVDKAHPEDDILHAGPPLGKLYLETICTPSSGDQG